MQLIILLIYFFSLPCFGEDINKDVLSIVNSVQKSTEKPRIDQNACCPACPDEASQKNEACSKNPFLSELLDSAKKRDGMLILITGKKYEVLRKQGEKKSFIAGVKSGKKHFFIDEDSSDIKGEKTYPDPDSQFLKDYNHLKYIFKDVKFRELCDYLATNQQKYVYLKSKVGKSKDFKRN